MKNVFVIAQDHQARVDLRTQLERQGYRVHSAASHADADRLLSSGTIPDLVILDIENHLLPAADFLYAIRSSRAFGKVPLIQMTSGEPLADKNTIATFTKPIDVSKLLWSLSAAGLEQLEESGPEASRSRSKSTS